MLKKSKGQAKKGATKRQHYVPRFVLRNFSTDGSTTSMLVLSSGKTFPGASIRGQCQEPYFYGADQVMEDSFSRDEGKISGYLGDLSEATLNQINQYGLGQLKLFVHYQLARTRGAADSLSNFAEAFAKSTLRGTAELNHDKALAEAVGRVRIKVPNAQNLSVWLAAKTTPLMFDLVAKFVVSKGDPFVIGDHPVVAYNQFAEHHPVLSRYPTITALALKGLQLFMPLSPSVTLAFYDPATYAYDGDSPIVAASSDDVRRLNEMQAVGARDCLYFHRDRSAQVDVPSLLAIRKRHPDRYSKHTAEGPFMPKPDGSIGRFAVVMHTDIRIGARFSFAHVRDHGTYEDHEGATIPVRSERLVEFTEFYGESLEARMAARKGVV